MERDARTARLLLDVARSLSRHRTVASVAQFVAEAVPPLMGADRSAFALLDEGSHEVAIAGMWGWPPHLAAKVVQYATNPQESPELCASLAAPAPAPVLLDATSSLWARAMLADFEVAAVAAAPVVLEGRVLGLVLAHWVTAAPAALDVAATERLTGLAGLAAVALDNTRLLEQVRHQASHDALTGLANRALLEERLDDALEATRRAAGRRVGVLFCDVDRFKRVNDSLGHGAGDQLLRHVSHALAASVTDRVTVARYSGDEFVVLLPDVASDGELREVAARIRTRLAEPMLAAGEGVLVSMAIGSALSDGWVAGSGDRAPQGAAALVARAGHDMYRFKARTRGLPVPVDDGVDRLRLEADLHDAASRGELVVHYQPQIDARTGGVVAVEALVRWDHPVLGLIPPGVFIPIAEDCGAIIDIGAHVLGRACRTVAGWQADGRPLELSVNVSASQLHAGGFCDFVRLVLRQTGLAPQHLVIEVTESQVVSDEIALSELRALRGLGVGISVDDFGTGYSSLSQLRRLPATEVKIDQSFTAELPGSASFITGIVALAHGLGLRVVAEGVEESDQLKVLTDAGCDRAQGYLLGRPAPELPPRSAPIDARPVRAHEAWPGRSVVDVAPFADFTDAVREVTRELRARFGMKMWAVTRQAGELQVLLHVDDAPDGYGVAPGESLSWDGSLCAAMIAGHGPHIAPRVSEIPAFAQAPNREHLPIEAYIGVPLVRADGRVFGTLCGFDPEPQPQSLVSVEGLVVVQARFLSTILELELANQDLRRRAERAEADATLDVLTGTGNRRGWDHVLAAEEARCRRYGHPACVLVIDINNLKDLNDFHGHAAGDDLLRACARVLTSTIRSSDYVARLGGDEFAVLTTESDRTAGQVELERLHAALQAAGISAAIGLGVRHPDGSLDDAWKRADDAMYASKLHVRIGLAP